MRKYAALVITAITLLLTACGTVFNAPFINVEETLLLQPGMTTEEVIDLCSEPLYVAFGNGEITAWVYQVRILDVSAGGQSITESAHSVARARWGISSDASSGLVKSGIVRDHGEVLPSLVLFFRSNSLQYWATFTNESSFPNVGSDLWENWLSE